MGRGLLAAALAAVAIAVAAPGAFAATIYVNDDAIPASPAGCAATINTTIGAGVAAASPGDIIHVCAGTYTESVTVPKADLLIRGTTRFGIVNKCAETTTVDPTVDTILSVPGGAHGLILSADGITVRGFTFKSASPGFSGLFTSGSFSGYSILRNLFELNHIGLYLNSNGGSKTTVTQNCFRLNDPDGIYSDGGLVDADITGNKFLKNVNPADSADASLTTTGPTLSKVNFSGNISNGSGTLFAITKSSDVTVAGNIAKDTAGSAIFVGGGNTDLKIQANILKNGLARGIRFNTSIFGGPRSSAVDVRGNIVTGFANFALHVEFNSLEDATFTSNIFKTNGPTGMRVHGNNGTLSFVGNIAEGSNFGCFDQSTMSTWTGNIGKPKNFPTTIC